MTYEKSAVSFSLCANRPTGRTGRGEKDTWWACPRGGMGFFPIRVESLGEGGDSMSLPPNLRWWGGGGGGIIGVPRGTGH